MLFTQKQCKWTFSSIGPHLLHIHWDSKYYVLTVQRVTVLYYMKPGCNWVFILYIFVFMFLYLSRKYWKKFGTEILKIGVRDERIFFFFMPKCKHPTVLLPLSLLALPLPKNPSWGCLLHSLWGWWSYVTCVVCSLYGSFWC